MTSAPSPAHRLFKFFSSFALATTVLSLLLLVTWLGTLEQVEHGLFETQNKYFSSMWITSIDMACCLRAMHLPHASAWNLPVLLPGGFLLMIVLSINMTLGGLVRLRKEAVWLALLPFRLVTGRFAALTPVPRAVGVFIAHFSIVFMLFAGLVEYGFKQDGAVALREGRVRASSKAFTTASSNSSVLSPRRRMASGRHW
ncbi:MAG: hypothetical protein ACOYMN_22470 [Roseimicrobium sp.]